MSSFMTWALVNDKLKNIHEFSIEENRENTQKKCSVCVSCGQPLIANVGEKKDWYYRHATESLCRGSLESVVHKYAKEALISLKQLYTPDTMLLFKGEKYAIDTGLCLNLSDYDCSIESNLTKNIRPDVYLKNKNILVCIEFFVTNKKDMTSINKYNAYIKEHLSDTEVYVLEADLRGIQDEINRNCTSKQDILDILTEYLVKASSYRVVTSTKLVKSDLILKASYHICSNNIVLCPASGNKYIFPRKECKKCKFNIKTGKNIECYGNTCLSSIKDLLLLLKCTEQDDITVKELQDSTSSFYDNIRDINSSLIDDLAYLYMIKSDKSFIGNCSICGEKLELAIGSWGTNVSGIRLNEGVSDEYAYRYCPKCKRFTLLRCPYCGKPLKLLKNRWDRIYLQCENYVSKSDKDNGRVIKDECDFSLTVYKDLAYKILEDEIIAVGGLDNLSVLKPNKIKSILTDTRSKAVLSKGSTNV